MSFDYLMHESRAVDFLAGKLIEGTLVLALGAGISLAANLPDWATLVNRLRTRAGLGPLSLPISCKLLRMRSKMASAGAMSESLRCW